MNNGRVEQVGAPLELYDRPANLFVAGFIGSPAMNFLPGTIADRMFVSEAGARIDLGRETRPGSVVLGIRPEHLAVRPDGEIVGEVQVLEPTGGETQVILRVGTAEMVATIRERLDLRPGDAVRLGFDPADRICSIRGRVSASSSAGRACAWRRSDCRSHPVPTCWLFNSILQSAAARRASSF